MKKIENDWHEAYISLNRLLGHLEAQRGISYSQGQDPVAKVSRSFTKSIVYAVVIISLILVSLFLAYIMFGLPTGITK
jgi:hypothetical protein